MISPSTSGTREQAYDPSSDSDQAEKKEEGASQCLNVLVSESTSLEEAEEKLSVIMKSLEEATSPCLDILASESTSSEEAEEKLKVIMERIDNSYKNAKTLSRIHTDLEKKMDDGDQALLENALKELYDNLFTRNNPTNSFAKLWFSKNFTNASSEKKKDFINEIFSLVKSAENLYKSKLSDTTTKHEFTPIVTEKEFKESYLGLIISLTAYNNLSPTKEEEQKIKNSVKKMHSLFFPDTTEISYKNWIDENLTGSSEEKKAFIVEFVDTCKKIKLDNAEKLNTHTPGFSGEKFSRLVAIICGELSEANESSISSALSESILESLIENGIHELSLFKCKKSSGVPRLTQLRSLSSECVGKIYKSDYEKIGKSSVVSLLFNLANSIGEIHHSNDAATYVGNISKIFNTKTSTLDGISGRNFSRESSLVLYSCIPVPIREEMFNILKSQLQKTSFLEELETKLKLAINGEDELSEVIRDNVSNSHRYTTELGELLCRGIISSLKQKNVGETDKSVTATRLESDKLKALNRFIANNGGMKRENPMFESSKKLLGAVKFNFSLLSPRTAHEMCELLSRFEHPQAEEAKQKSSEITKEAVKRVYSSAIDDIKSRLLTAKTHEEKFSAWLSTSQKMELEMSHIPGGENKVENLLVFMSKNLYRQDAENLKKILHEISTSMTTLRYMESICRSPIITESIRSLNLWKKSFGATEGVMSMFFRMVEEPQDGWIKIISKSLNLYHHKEYNYFYQASGPLPHDVLKTAQKQCLPNTSNGEKHHIEVDGKEYTIPQSVWLDITRSNFMVQGKPIIADTDGETGISKKDELTHSKTANMLRELDKLDLTNEALDSLLSLMNQNTAAQLLFAINPSSIFMFPEKSRLNISPSMSKDTLYSAVKTPEGDLIFTCSISGEVKALQELPKGVHRAANDPNYSESAETIPLDPSLLTDGKFPDQAAEMKVRINADGTADILEIMHTLTGITPAVVDNLIKVRRMYP
ncbi:hypothetical protein [Candidatus Ichthyocystis hellenicum]|uniref:hypothetical protein n=1 Tax=Candidatus Ichthyocystis hellenicum TaxID=1561003 RepID=UPI000B8894A8|nr:hypothetical protein [Candidatus Ichthyocystis hellenicum]